MTPNAIKAMWIAGNELGDGYHACDCDVDCNCDINNLPHLGLLMRAAEPSDDSIALYEDSEGSLIAVGMLGGPWAVSINRTSEAQDWLDQFAGDADRALANVGQADASIEQDWEVGATIVTFRDCSSVIFDGPTVIIEGAYR